MIAFNKKRIFGVLGAPRAGKDSVAQYLCETRGFKQMAFADQIKEECGISKEDFEAAKISGKIEEIRKKLWAYSEEVRATDPTYFIRRVINKAIDSKESVIITDIRTKEELEAVYKCDSNCISRVYYVVGKTNADNNGILDGSKIPMALIQSSLESGKARKIENKSDGLFYFFQELDQIFFREDIIDLLSNIEEKTKVESYLGQFDVRQVRKAIT